MIAFDGPPPNCRPNTFGPYEIRMIGIDPFR